MQILNKNDEWWMMNDEWWMPFLLIYSIIQLMLYSLRKNPYKSAFPERISRICIPNCFGLMSILHFRFYIINFTLLFNRKDTKEKSHILFSLLETPRELSYPRTWSIFLCETLCLLCETLCNKTLKNPLKSAFSIGISRICVPNCFCFLSSVHFP